MVYDNACNFVFTIKNHTKRDDMPEAKGKENIVPSSPRGAPENGNIPDSPNTNGTGKNAKRSKGKMALAKVHLLDGTVWDCPVEVSTLIFKMFFTWSYYALLHYTKLSVGALTLDRKKKVIRFFVEGF